jgi:hypothetical protein
LKKYIVLICLLLWPCIELYAQQGNVWVFGNHYGLDFNSGTPVFFDTTAIDYREGSASVCDSAGQLLFYTDGTKVWNRLHQQMPNGYYMATGNSTTQPAVIIPIGYTNQFYIFTTDTPWPSGPTFQSQLKYHIVDVNANGGLGDVTLKNQILWEGISEKIAAVRHCNGQDWWIVTRKANNDTYGSFLLTNSGIDSIPVLSYTGLDSFIEFDLWTVGQLKISPNGKFYANVYQGYGIEIGSFNDFNGVLDPIISDFTNPYYNDGYGCSFSYDSKYVFCSRVEYDYATANDTVSGNEIITSVIDKFDITSADSSSIIQSKISLMQRDSIIDIFSLQLAPDRNIYARVTIADTASPPYFRREKLFYIKEGVDSLIQSEISFNPLGWNYSTGLPSFPDAIFTNHHKALLRMPTCVAGVYDSIPFYDSLLTTTRDYIWDFGDPASGVNNSANAQYPIHTFSAPGTYTVTLTLPSDCNPLAVSKQVIITQTPPMVPTISINNIYLESTLAANYQWYLNGNIIAGASAQNYIPVANGNYTVTITDTAGCSITSLPFNLTTVNVKTITQNKNVVIYPNPANIELFINTQNKYSSYVIYDLLAKEMMRNSFSTKIDISNLAKGVYIIALKGADGVVQKMWVKE